MMPDGWPIVPMELTICDTPYDASDTLFQVKWDGVRCLAYAYPDGVRDACPRHSRFAGGIGKCPQPRNCLN